MYLYRQNQLTKYIFKLTLYKVLHGHVLVNCHSYLASIWQMKIEFGGH